MHRQVADYLAAALGPDSECVWTTFPAGGGGRVRGAQLKARGLRAGWPDIQIVARVPTTIAGPPFVTAFIGIELKTESGAVSPEQADCFNALSAVGARIFLCRSLNDVERVLKMFAVPLRPTLMAGGGWAGAA